MMKRQGLYGPLVVPAVGVEVTVYFVDGDSASGEVVDHLEGVQGYVLDDGTMCEAWEIDSVHIL